MPMGPCRLLAQVRAESRLPQYSSLGSPASSVLMRRPAVLMSGMGWEAWRQQGWPYSYAARYVLLGLPAATAAAAAGMYSGV